MNRLWRQCVSRFATTSSSRPVSTTASAVTSSPRRHLQFVFIEGAAATGKSSLCEQLHKDGYTVQFENFVELCANVSRIEAFTGSFFLRKLALFRTHDMNRLAR